MKLSQNLDIPLEFTLKPTQVPLFKNYPSFHYDYIVGMIESDIKPTSKDIEKLNGFFQLNQNYGREKRINVESPLAKILIAYDHYKIITAL
jgi:hypothetical protein